MYAQTNSNSNNYFPIDIYGQLSNSSDKFQPIEMIYDYNSIISFKISGKFLHGKQRGAIFITTHSPDHMPSMIDAITHKLKPGEILDWRFSKKEWNFRPPPHRPRCFIYRSG